MADTRPGPAAADFLAVLRHKVEGIVKRIHIKYSQNIRLPHEAMLATSGIHYGEQEWADFEQILAQRDNGQDIYIHKSRKRYSISKILGIFTPANQAPSKEPSMTQNVFINNSTIGGSVNTAKVIKDSFNNLGESKINDDLRTALDQLLQEISKLQQAASAEQAPQVAKAAKAMARVVEDSAEAQTDRAWYQVSWPGLCDALSKLGTFGANAVALAQKVQPILST